MEYSAKQIGFITTALSKCNDLIGGFGKTKEFSTEETGIFKQMVDNMSKGSVFEKYSQLLPLTGLLGKTGLGMLTKTPALLSAFKQIKAIMEKELGMAPSTKEKIDIGGIMGSFLGGSGSVGSAIGGALSGKGGGLAGMAAKAAVSGAASKLAGSLFGKK